jgi:phospholipid/cholesterol/gamma-HCH transport system substrate-binding protein
MARTNSAAGSAHWRHARVGALIIAALLVLAFAIFRVGAIFDVFADRYEIVALVSGATGLIEGSAVHLAGQRVGQVSAIEFIPPDRKIGDKHLLLRLSVSQEVASQIRRDSHAYIRAQGLLGDKFVDIRPGTPAAAILQPGDTIPSSDPIDFDVLLAQGSEFLDQVQLTLVDVQRVTDGLASGQGTFGRLLTDESLYLEATEATAQFRAAMRDINRSDGTIGRLLRDPALYHQVQGAVARIDTLGAAILRSEGTLGQLLHSDTLHRGFLGIVHQAGGTVARIDTAVVGLSGFLQGMTEGEGTIQRLMTDPALYDQLLKAIVDLQILILDIRTHPTRYRPQVTIDLF